ncbi:MAG TPA: nuclear transport factor 2 family protein [Pseudonocardia sp.]|jgi:ketosteroid isomerase-like protein
MVVQDNVAVVRAFTDALQAGDLNTCLELISPNLVFSEAESLPFGGEYRGKDGFLRFLRNVSRHFTVELTTPQIVGGDSLVAVRVHGKMTSRATGRSMPMDVVDLYQLTDGKVARVDVFYKEPTAVADLCREDQGVA